MRFKADPEIFKETTVYEFETLETRLREQAFLNAGVRIVLTDERDAENVRSEEFHYEGGVSSFVEYLNRKQGEVIHPEPIYFCGDRGGQQLHLRNRHAVH